MGRFESVLLYGLLGITLFAVVFSIFSLIKPVSENASDKTQVMGQIMGRMSLTEFDREKGKQFMDKDADGKCDVCGMPVEMCLDAGQIQCNMGGNATIGILGSQHVHADFKVFLEESQVDFANERYYMKSSFIHLDDNKNKEEALGVLHMHATGAPLRLFFESIEKELPPSVNVYVNGKLHPEWIDYVFEDLDSILITDAENEVKIKEQLSLVTDYAKEH